MTLQKFLSTREQFTKGELLSKGFSTADLARLVNSGYAKEEWRNANQLYVRTVNGKAWANA